MAVLRIRTWGDPALRQPARPVERVTRAHRALIHDMRDTMREAPGVGLAGPQIGVSERIFVFETDDAGRALINPEIMERSAETAEGEEGCLSIPGLYYPVQRRTRVRVAGLDEDGNPLSVDATDFLARVFQHEIDHLDGVLFIDRLGEDHRKEALATLRDRALGLPSRARQGPRGSRPAGGHEEAL